VAEEGNLILEMSIEIQIPIKENLFKNCLAKL